MTTAAEHAADLYAQLHPAAAQRYADYILQRTPAEYQSEMATLVGEFVGISDGAEVIVNDFAGTPNAKSPAVATVADGELTHVTLSE